eukprot:TRINITY_DN16997_c0_g1_i1.p1 TRINITY_DN16997_c0_g1~~TRINITY_DN16997_c0_g1_i1.p1  ORF type:complete len:393 (+),score=71.88 TRINITY_DN16997_c0_g1_i1:881-2059(+)
MRPYERSSRTAPEGGAASTSSASADAPPSRSSLQQQQLKNDDASEGKKHHGRPALSPSQLLSFLAALAYGSASLAMVFLNKALLIQYRHSMTVLTLQMLASVVLIRLGSLLRIVNVRPLDFSTTGRKLLPLACCYSANVACALTSIRNVNIPMYIALKRLTPLAVLVLERVMGKRFPPFQITASVLVTAGGCLIAAIGDFSFDLKGYSMALLSVGFQTAHLVLVEKSGAEQGLSTTELLQYNAVLSLPFLSALLVFSGEAAVSFPELWVKCSASVPFTLMMLLSLFMGILLNFTMFLCTLLNSALTTTIVGVLKGVGSTTLGFFVLGGVKVRPLNVTGLVINGIGGVWYSWAKYRLKKSRKGARREREREDAVMEPLLPTSVPPRPVVGTHA